MSELLSPESVEARLGELNSPPGRPERWTAHHPPGGELRLRTHVYRSGPEAANLISAVMTAADAMNHHPVITEADGVITFEVWSHSAGGVTEKDFALAARIDELARLAG